ncbi:hypothetical protein LQ953_01880 [Sphingomonas sp. IC-56]|uniref:hypothetical protein n=1 Tax=Sphingomonas sp. IC-56 TaxID=2898529 RepID=UPI001E41F759|nr:hypothetical protein [Sphingomonas sp. IC-56]MCD2322761.1 hypothetical protein [Sphingomonas sp. IC-56]
MAEYAEPTAAEAPQPMGGPGNAEGTMSASTLEGSPQPAAPEAPAAATPASGAPIAPVEPVPQSAAEPAQPASNDVTSTSSDSSAQDLSFDTGTSYNLSEQGSSITTGGEPGGYEQTIGSSDNGVMGDSYADGTLNSQSSSNDTEFADGSSVSTDSASFTGGLDVGAMFGAAMNNANATTGDEGGSTSSDSGALVGAFEAAALVNGETSSTDIENADGSSSSSDSGSLSTELGLNGLLGGTGSSIESNDDGDSSSESGSLLGTLDSVAGLTIEGTQNTSESADGETSNSSELTIDLDTFLEGDAQSEYHASETGSDGSSSSYDQVNSAGFDVENDLGGSQSDSSYEDEDAALINVDLSGDGALLGLNSDADSLLSVDTGLDSFDHGGFG